MDSFMTLLKVLLKSKFSFDKTPKNKKVWLYVGLAAIYLLIISMVALYIYLAVPAFKESNAINSLVLFLMLCVAGAIIIMGLVSMLSYVYFSRDTEFLSTLPVKASTVFAVKLAVVYFTELVMSVALLLPLLLVIGITAKMSVLFYIAIPLIILLTPLATLLIIALVAIPLMYVVSFFRNKGAVTTVFLILLFAGFFVLYMYAVIGLNSGAADNGSVDITKMLSVIKVLSYIVYPLTCLANFACLTSFAGLNTAASALINLAIGLGSVAILAFVSVLIAGAVYQRGVSAQLESAKKTTVKEAVYKSSTNNVITLLKREWRDLTRNTSFGFQCLSGLILVPLMVLLFHFMPQATASGTEDAESAAEIAAALGNIMNYFSLWILMGIGIGQNTTVSTAVSREGKNFAIFKTLPVSNRDAVNAKLILGFIVSSITVLVSTILYAALKRMDPLETVLMLVFFFIYNYGFCCFGLWNDIRAPKLDWIAPNEVVKRSSKVYIPMLINFGLTIPLMIVFALLSGIAWLKWLILFVLVIGLAILFDYLLRTGTDKYYDKIEV